ncbi:hypothetical protein Lser_V15G18651 [Lactuca serriola]
MKTRTGDAFVTTTKCLFLSPPSVSRIPENNAHSNPYFPNLSWLLSVSVNGFHVQNCSSRVLSGSCQFKNRKSTVRMIGNGRDSDFVSRLGVDHIRRMELGSAGVGSLFHFFTKSRSVKAQASGFVFNGALEYLAKDLGIAENNWLE